MSHAKQSKSGSRRPRAADRAAPRIFPVTLLFIAISLVGMFAYAGSAAPVVLYRLLSGGVIVAIWVGSAAGIGAFLLRRPLPDSPDLDEIPLLHFANSTALGLGLIGLVTLGLGLLGWLNRLSAAALLLPGLILTIPVLLKSLRYRPRSVDRDPAEIGDASSVKPATPASAWRWLWLAAAPFLAISLAGTMVPPGLLWRHEEPHGYDVVEYHLQVPREWYEAGRIVPLHHNVFSYFPMGVEMHYLLAMHLQGGPWEAMYTAQLMHLVLVVLAILAGCGIINQFAANKRSAILAGVALATLPWFAQLGAIAYNEGGFLLFSTIAIGAAMRAMTGPRHRMRHFAFGGIMAGLACGTKLTAVPEILLGVPIVCVSAAVLTRLGRMRSQTGSGCGATRLSSSKSAALGCDPLPLRTLTFGCPLYVLAGVLTFSPWLARNAAWTGNPVFPEVTSIFGKAHWTDIQVLRWHHANHDPGPDKQGVAGHLFAAWEQVLGNWQFGYLLLPLCVGAIVLLLFARRYRPQLPAALLPAGILLLLSIFWIGFTHLQGRFFLLAAPLGAILIAHVEWSRAAHWVAALVLLAAAVGCWGLHRRLSLVILGTPDTPSGMVDALGREPLDWLLPPELADLQKSDDKPSASPDPAICLIGDARAFFYQAPMSRLCYRTVFDVNTTNAPPAPDADWIIASWAGSARPPLAWLVIDGPELLRFSKTYLAIPAPPEHWSGMQSPTVVAPGKPIPK